MQLFSKIKELFFATTKKKFSGLSLRQSSVIAVAIIIFSWYFVFIQPPIGFPKEAYINIKKGETVRQVSRILSEKNIIISPSIFTILIRISGSAGIQAGTYHFYKPTGLLFVVYRLHTGDLGIAPRKITLFEGMTNLEMGNALARRYPKVTSDAFRIAGAGEEGYLFPDTYSFSPDISASDIVTVLRDNFNTRIASVTPQIKASGHSLKEIVTMASLVEREGRTLKEKRMIAGILWNRLRIGMLLQVDAVFGYIFKKPTYSPSFSDLKVDSPYNTYIHKGLPPNPIDNPGLESILAAATPTKTKYFYYITGNDGKMHYARNLVSHNRNVALYLKR